MAAERSRRLTAGNRLGRLLNDEESAIEEFYETAYGGFKNEENDDEYEALEDGDDIVDSDFSNEGDDDEQASDHDEELKKTRKKSTKYKEPVQVQPKVKPIKKATVIEKKNVVSNRREVKSERMSKRTSTAAKTAATKERQKHRQSRKKPKRIEVEEHIFTQEELLAEAKETEIENLKSLEKYQQLENERKTKQVVKKALTCPMIRYHSLRMPLVEDLNSSDYPDKESIKFQERTFLSFCNDPHDEHFKRTFDQFSFRKTRVNDICPITGLPALYLDPVTNLPYRNVFAFRIIREAYYQQLEAKGDQNNEGVQQWIQWRLSSKQKCREIAQNIIELCKKRKKSSGGATLC